MTRLFSFWLVLSGLVLDTALAEIKKPWVAVAGEEWRVVDQADLEVKSGSALDFSLLFPPAQEAGKSGFAKINDKGEIVFEKAPEIAPRFFGFSGTMNSLPDYSPAEIEQYADQIAKAGYNLFRPHFLDMMLMRGSQEHLVFNPEQLDRWDRLSAALKKRGIYLYLDATTSWAAFYAVENPWGSEAKAYRLGSRLYYDEKARAHWKEGVKRLLEHVNPYTKVALKDEPQVVAVQLRNEASLNFLMTKKEAFDPDIVGPFRKWLEQRYGTTEKLKSAWTVKSKEGTETIYLKEGETIANVSLPPVDGRGPDSKDLQRCFLQLEKETFQWLSKAAMAMGVRVPITDLNVGSSMELALSRSVMPLIDNHTYFYHPTGYYSPGAKDQQKNPIPLGVDYYRWLAATRHWGAPFFCSEWGHLFWNSYRYMAGLTFPTYAAHQNWQMIAQFSDPVVLSSRAFEEPHRRFRICGDPALKASEYMSAVLFRRKDLLASPNPVEIRVATDAVFAMPSPRDGIPMELSRLALLCGIGLTVSQEKEMAPRGVIAPRFSVQPEQGSEEVTLAGSQGIKEGGGSGAERLPQLIRKLREKGVLSAENRTNPDLGIYESDTGEILLDEQRHLMRIVSLRSEGICVPQGTSEIALKQIRVKNEGPEAAVFVTSLTTAPIASSSRSLVIINVDALNSEMTFEDAEKKVLVDQGKEPVLMRVARVQLAIKHSNPKKLKMWALAANGERREEIPLAIQEGEVRAVIHTGKLLKGATPYFEVQESP